MFDRYRSRLIAHPLGYLWTDPPAPDPNAPPPPDPKAPPAPDPNAPPADKTFSFKEDRTNWVDPTKFKAAETAVNRTARELEVLRGQLSERDKRIAALAGLTPIDPDAAEADKIAQAFFALPQFAHLKGVTPDLLKQVQALVADGESIKTARDHVWNQHTDKFLGNLDTAFADEIGAEELTPEQQQFLHAAFDTTVPSERANPEAYAKFKEQFEKGDSKLITEFVTKYASSILEPARRLATVGITQRRAVPRSGSGHPVVTQVPKPDYSDPKISISDMLEDAEKRSEAAGR